ncbi:hypothetical protein BOO86_08665 [Mycobacterium sp. CBMA 234]|uniref:cytochrome C oxidase subunit IV family protein n=1 Tax=Mycolicibacterium sp. CBMA 234 TaxID=1918495 RepID=UPI0012DE3C7D|nr:cytochrome C oxidase subunit IV family protein [Mycolicibacterium sp. CBMA 234]MUL64531.1 hypothetical protein [Mycolicibacterium sp. CBMA 234]
MVRILCTRAGFSWLLLIGATVLSTLLGIEHGLGDHVAVVVLGLAAAKIRLIGLDFMELRRAPVALRAAFETYCATLWLVLSSLYLWL